MENKGQFENLISIIEKNKHLNEKNNLFFGQKAFLIFNFLIREEEKQEKDFQGLVYFFSLLLLESIDWAIDFSLKTYYSCCQKQRQNKKIGDLIGGEKEFVDFLQQFKQSIKEQLELNCGLQSQSKQILEMKVLFDIYVFSQQKDENIIDFVKKVILPILIEKQDPCKIQFQDFFIECVFYYLFNLKICYKLKFSKFDQFVFKCNKCGQQKKKEFQELTDQINQTIFQIQFLIEFLKQIRKSIKNQVSLFLENLPQEKQNQIQFKELIEQYLSYCYEFDFEIRFL